MSFESCDFPRLLPPSSPVFELGKISQLDNLEPISLGFHVSVSFEYRSFLLRSRLAGPETRVGAHMSLRGLKIIPN